MLFPSEPQLRSALHACRQALRQIAEYKLDPGLAERMREMGEHKDILPAEEQSELLALTRFAQQRILEKLEAELALQRLNAVYPDLDSKP